MELTPEEFENTYQIHRIDLGLYCITMIEQIGYHIFADKGCETQIRYEYRIHDFNVEINFYGCDLANVLDITGNATLNDMGLKFTWKH